MLKNRRFYRGPDGVMGKTYLGLPSPCFSSSFSVRTTRSAFDCPSISSHSELEKFSNLPAPIFSTFLSLHCLLFSAGAHPLLNQSQPAVSLVHLARIHVTSTGRLVSLHPDES